jgi:hypothetical protein
LSSTSNIISGTISCGNITGKTGTTITAPTITASTNLFYGSTNVGTKIATIETSLNGKQATLTAGSNITIDQTTNTISSTGGGTTTINDGDLTIAKTNGLQDALNSKQNTLTPFSNLSINKVSTLSDITAGGNLLFMDNSGTKNVKTEFSATNSAINLKQNQIFFLTDLTCATLDCSNLNIDGESIDTKIANSIGTKQNTLTSSSNILTNRIDVNDKLVITNTSPSLYLKDTNQRSGMIHMNDNRMYFLSGVANSESWSQINNQWPLYLQTDNNTAVFGGNITSPNWIRSTPVYRLTDQFPGGGNLVTIASNVSITGSGNFIIHFHCGGYASQSGLNGIFELRFRNNSGGGVTSLIE